MKFLRRAHLHPFLIGIFPVLSLFAHNQSQLQANAPWRALAVVLGGTALVFVLLRWIISDWTRAGFITTFASFLFFIYGPIKNFISLQNSHFASLNQGMGHYLLPIISIVLVVGVWLLLKKVPHGETSLLTFNSIALATLILPLISIISFAITHSSGPITHRAKTLPTLVSSSQPDIYYIILDMYGRSDSIETEFGYDNSAFLDGLRKQGFYVAPCSSSNYTLTQLSLASSLNMNYLPTLGNDFVTGHAYNSQAAALIRDNAVRQYLQQYGYSFVSFQNRFPFLNIPNSDVSIAMPNQNKYIQPFEVLLIEQTPGIIVLNELDKFSGTFILRDTRKYGSIYDGTLFILDQLTRLPSSVPGPKFVYAHLNIPHPPYIFGPNGEYTGNDDSLNGGPNESPIDQAAYTRGYTNQVKYIDDRISQIAAEIIAKSKTPPVIIIQGDHGFGGWGEAQRRLPNLNAYYLPGVDANKLLYPAITPVNTFRVVLDTYFQGHFDLLPDLTYLSNNDHDSYDAKLYDRQLIGCQAK